MRAPAIICLICLTGCSYGAFTDLEDKAPAVRISQEGAISSASFGDHLAGKAAADDQGGGLLAIVGNAEPSFCAIHFTATGKPSNKPADRDKIKNEFDNPNRFNAIAPAPYDKPYSTFKGPFAYVASSSSVKGTVRVMDLSVTRQVGMEFEAPTDPTPVSDFGMSVTPANFTDANDNTDLAVGAANAVVLMRTDQWPAMKETVVVSGGGFPVGKYSVIASGDLDNTNEDEVVAAIPESNIVVIIHHVADCFADTSVTCNSFIKLEVPEEAAGFGWSLLVDSSNKRLLVGAPDSDSFRGKVFAYEFESSHFGDSPPPLPEPVVLQPAESKAFGKSLVMGQVTGTGNIYIIGAPGSEANGTTGAGKIFLVDNNMNLLDEEGVALASPEENTLLGQQLAILPFRASSVVHDVLVASGGHEVFVFFANLGGDRDVRER